MFLLNNTQMSDLQVAYRSLFCRPHPPQPLIIEEPNEPGCESWSSMVALIAWSLGTLVFSVTINRIAAKYWLHFQSRTSRVPIKSF
ncbi:hypothetical protein ABID25_006372 [Mesorhizobium abyssinicae]